MGGREGGGGGVEGWRGDKSDSTASNPDSQGHHK